jgi:hypothetical protein
MLSTKRWFSNAKSIAILHLFSRSASAQEEGGGLGRLCGGRAGIGHLSYQPADMKLAFPDILVPTFAAGIRIEKVLPDIYLIHFSPIINSDWRKPQ